MMPANPVTSQAWNQLRQGIDVWVARLDELQQWTGRLKAVLNLEERERAARFRTSHALRSFVCRRGLLRLLLSHYVQAPPESFSFQLTELGKPAVNGLEGFEFSSSSSRNVVLIAMTLGRRVGVDAETEASGFDFWPIAERTYHASECSLLRAAAPAVARRAFFRYWTRKEAFLKARGDGLPGMSPCLETPLDSPHPVLAAPGGGNDVQSGWRLEGLPAGPNDQAALCVESTPEREFAYRLIHLDSIPEGIGDRLFGNHC